MAWLATEHASALDGEPGNTKRLAAELDQLGIVDRRMSFYMPLRLREIDTVGFSGFEARYFSLFPSYGRDMVPAIDLQQLLLAASYRMALEGAGHPRANPRRSNVGKRTAPAILLQCGRPARLLCS